MTSGRPKLGADAPQVELFTDGACSGNPGPGGWGYLLRMGTHEREGAGGEKHTTNNRMEIMGAIRGLEALKRPCRVNLCSDSRYVVQAINEWLAGWKKKGWRRNSGADGELLNADLWKELDVLLHVHEVEARWVRGHAGHAENERCDELARHGIELAKAG
ncbi:MAG TPA: ribonuclease HI [Myxococcales bacterium]|jgi:ribonuclease HI